jgi:hypothetical protein
LTCNVDGLLSVTVAESDERVDDPTVLILKHVGQVLKILHGLIANCTDGPVLFRDIHRFFAHIFECGCALQRSYAPLTAVSRQFSLVKKEDRWGSGLGGGV